MRQVDGPKVWQVLNMGFPRTWGASLMAGVALSAWLGLCSGTFSRTARAESQPDSSDGSKPHDGSRSTEPDAHWCAPELTVLNDRACYYSGSKLVPEGQPAAARTLVIFLHSLTSAAPRAAWEQQMRMARMARSYGFSMLIPRGRSGLGPGRDPRTLAWPTALELQKVHEPSILLEWKAALKAVERRAGSFERVLIFGFSNGAYYATSLAFRERFPVDGVAVFAGGSGSKYQRLCASRAKHRVPMFVGYGTQDPDHSRQKDLVKVLKLLGWPHRSLAARVGHTVAGSQLRAALKFLGHRIPGTE